MSDLMDALADDIRKRSQRAILSKVREELARILNNETSQIDKAYNLGIQTSINIVKLLESKI